MNITEYQHQLHAQLTAQLKKERDQKAGLRGAFGNWLKRQKAHVKFWPTWERDGHESALHQTVHHHKSTLYYAFGDESHPMHATAIEAHKAGLLPGIHQ